VNPDYWPDGQWRLKLGLRPLQLEAWIEIDEQFGSELRLKQALLSQRHADLFVSLPTSLSAQQRVLDLLVQHLLRFFPEHYQQQGQSLQNLITGQVWNLAELEPLDLAGRLVQEDLCLMQAEAGVYRLTAASVCFPSRWEPRSKLGRELTQIHRPVPGYGDRLARPVDGFFDRLQPEHPGWRLNWSIVDSPDLCLLPREEPCSALITATNAGQRLWLRIERQTLRRLAGDVILFTIRTYVHRLDQIVRQPTVAAHLAAAIRQMPPEMQAYKTLASIRAVLLEYLAH